MERLCLGCRPTFRALSFTHCRPEFLNGRTRRPFRLQATPAFLTMSKPKSQPFSSSRSPYQDGNGRRAILTCIGINTAVFFGWQYALPNTLLGSSSHRDLAVFMTSNFVTSLDRVRSGRVWTVVTNAFSQVGLGHFAANMISMYAFGSVLTFVPGIAARHIYALVLGAGAAGSLAFLAFEASKGRSRNSRGLIGASGAVMGLGAAASCLNPRATMLLYGFVPVPLWGLMLGYFALDNYMIDSQHSRTASSAHIGGLVFGALYYALRLRRFGGILR